MVKFLLAVAIVVLSIIQAGWMAMFALELFFDTSRSTAAERARIIFRYMAFLVTVQIGIVIIVILILYSNAPTGIILGN